MILALKLTMNGKHHGGKQRWKEMDKELKANTKFKLKNGTDSTIRPKERFQKWGKS